MKSAAKFQIPLYVDASAPISKEDLYKLITSPFVGECSNKQMVDADVHFECPADNRNCGSCAILYSNSILELKAIKKQNIKRIKTCL